MYIFLIFTYIYIFLDFTLYVWVGCHLYFGLEFFFYTADALNSVGLWSAVWSKSFSLVTGQELTKREVEYVALSRDTTETDLKQRREIRSGTAFYIDQVNPLFIFKKKKKNLYLVKQAWFEMNPSCVTSPFFTIMFQGKIYFTYYAFTFGQ